MTSNEKSGAMRRWRPWRAAIWVAVIALILLVPLVAMQFTHEVAWTGEDFVSAGAMLGAVGMAYELAASRGDPVYRIASGCAIAAAFMLVWITGAVGIIGDEGNPANLMFGGVLAIALVGAAIARFRPAGMAVTMLAAALAQAVVGVIALVGGWGATGPSWPWDVLFLSGFFTALWLASAWLFRKTARSSDDLQPTSRAGG